MHKCLDLSRLPKAPGIQSINRRHVTPGSPLPLIFPGTGSYDPARAVEPKHPATRLKAHAFPRFSCLAFMLRAVPKGVLLRPEFERWEDPKERSMMIPRNRKEKRLDMSIFFMISKKKTNKRAVVRNRIAMRIRAGFELIVSRGADAEPREIVEVRNEGLCVSEESVISNVVRKPRKKQNHSARQSKLASLASSAVPSNLGLVSNPAPTKHLILQDWTYVMSPSLLTYRMPLPDLIKHLREGLESIQAQAKKLDAVWALDRKPIADVPLAITNEEPTVDWRQVAADEDELPTLFDFDEPEQEPNRSINWQKRPLKLFFPTLPPSVKLHSDKGSIALDLTSALVARDQSVRSPSRPIQPAPSVPSANKPSRRSLGSISDSPKTLRPYPAPSTFRMGAMDRLAVTKNRPLVVLGRKPDRRPS
ncbi:hypothetical protein K503DRAFT_240056 [Rhizopogon vinicolor AM-OR11-026]|uniref:Uncharacterized protein n=1 Tax=Rhizopogon vinicolor AM-OR11-026 TaxID=1314800 RepID=A0A1B7MXK4_9AGAM|nr:hypothetical protein K503DRAFT_240056 [Rhizopogon vinicolor AM-OR11-026]